MFKLNFGLRLVVIGFAMLAPVVQADLIGGEELRDPTRPADVMMPPSAEGAAGLLSGLINDAAGLLSRRYAVSFIRAGGSEPVAMINEQLVKAGDTIGEAEIIAIDADSVSLMINGEVQRVSSFDGSVKSKIEAPQ